jgi:hypothetical protein
MRFRCPFCRRTIDLDAGAAGYISAQTYAHLHPCPKRPIKETDDAVYTRAQQLAEKVVTGEKKRKPG